jgi:hypothetical protein
MPSRRAVAVSSSNLLPIGSAFAWSRMRPGFCPIFFQAFGNVGFASGLLAELEPSLVGRPDEVGAPCLLENQELNLVGHDRLLGGVRAGTRRGTPYIAARRSVSRHMQAAFAALSANGTCFISCRMVSR